MFQNWKDKDSLMYIVCFGNSCAPQEIVEKAKMIIDYIKQEDLAEYNRVYNNCQDEI